MPYLDTYEIATIARIPWQNMTLRNVEETTAAAVCTPPVDRTRLLLAVAAGDFANQAFDAHQRDQLTSLFKVEEITTARLILAVERLTAAVERLIAGEHLTAPETP